MEILQSMLVIHMGNQQSKAKQVRTSNFIIAADHIGFLGANLKRQNILLALAYFQIIKSRGRFG